jgi:hypothetical protein
MSEEISQLTGHKQVAGQRCKLHKESCIVTHRSILFSSPEKNNLECKERHLSMHCIANGSGMWLPCTTTYATEVGYYPAGLESCQTVPVLACSDSACIVAQSPLHCYREQKYVLELTCMVVEAYMVFACSDSIV